MELQKPEQHNMCGSSDHYTDLLIWGQCPHCKRVWGLSSEDKASEEYPEFINKGKVVSYKESVIPF